MNNYLPADQAQVLGLCSRQWPALDIPHYHKMPIQDKVEVSLYPGGSHHTWQKKQKHCWTPWSWWCLPTHHISWLWYVGLFSNHAGHEGLSHHNIKQVCVKQHMLIRRNHPVSHPLFFQALYFQTTLFLTDSNAFLSIKSNKKSWNIVVRASRPYSWQSEI